MIIVISFSSVILNSNIELKKLSITILFNSIYLLILYGINNISEILYLVDYM